MVQAQQLEGMRKAKMLLTWHFKMETLLLSPRETLVAAEKAIPHSMGMMRRTSQMRMMLHRVPWCSMTTSKVVM
jgi:hypothetical protein